jgi:hypothetical protein
LSSGFNEAVPGQGGVSNLHRLAEKRRATVASAEMKEAAN